MLPQAPLFSTTTSGLSWSSVLASASLGVCMLLGVVSASRYILGAKCFFYSCCWQKSLIHNNNQWTWLWRLFLCLRLLCVAGWLWQLIQAEQANLALQFSTYPAPKDNHAKCQNSHRSHQTHQHRRHFPTKVSKDAYFAVLLGSCWCWV
jgi:hypothetical protein